MILAITYGSILAATGILSWVMASLLERRQSRVKVSDAHQKLKQAEAKSLHFQSEFSRVQKEIQHLQTNFKEKQSSHDALLAETRHAFQAKIMRCTVFGLAFGLLTGGFMVGVYSNTQAKLDVLQATMDLQVRAQVAEAQLEIAAKQNLELREKLRISQSGHLSTRELYAVTKTKLDILLQHMGDKKSSKLGQLDIEALRLNAQMSEKQNLSNPSEIFPLPLAAV